MCINSGVTEEGKQLKLELGEGEALRPKLEVILKQTLEVLIRPERIAVMRWKI